MKRIGSILALALGAAFFLAPRASAQDAGLGIVPDPTTPHNEGWAAYFNDHPEALGKAFSQAIVDASSCAPDSAGGGSVTWVADVSLAKKKIDVKAPKDGRSLKNGKVVSACAQAIKKRLETQGFEGVPHDHAKYRVEVVATYSGALK